MKISEMIRSDVQRALGLYGSVTVEQMGGGSNTFTVRNATHVLSVNDGVGLRERPASRGVLAYRLCPARGRDRAMTLTLVHVDRYFSTYRDAAGEDVHVLSRTYRSTWDTDAACRLQSALDVRYPDDMRDMLALVLTSRHAHWAEGFEPCDMCADWDTDRYHTDDETLCGSCFSDHYICCDDCGEYVHEGCGVGVEGDRMVCESCRARSYHYCDDCDELVHDDSDAHYHEPEQCLCEAREQTFTLAGLGNDDQRTISLPAGTIDEEGMCSIRSYLYAEGYPTAASLATTLDPAWVVTKGGTFLKRLSSALYKHDGSKLPADVVSHVGNIAARHSTGADFLIAVTRDVNVSAYEMGNEGSCWYAENNGGHEDSLCYLKSSGGMALRSFDDHGNVEGRSWVVPLDSELQATIDAEGASAFVIFNHYGDFEGYAGARILAQLTGMTYRTLSGGFDLGNAYINPGTAILVAPADVIASAPAYLSLNVSEHVTRESVDA